MPPKIFDLAILFTGHMVDLPGRAKPRFPQHAEPIAWHAIRDAIERARAQTRGRVVGIASGARGGDLLFHEACRLFGLERRMILPFPVAPFIETSVAGVPNAGWEQMFRDNWTALAPSEREILLDARDESGFALCNLRLIELGTEIAKSSTIIALWDGKAGDGPGGTGECVEAVRRMGGKADIIDAAILLDPARSV
jgi:hypothetical protein